MTGEAGGVGGRLPSMFTIHGEGRGAEFSENK